MAGSGELPPEIADALVRRYLEDRDARRELSITEYRELYPDYADSVAAFVDRLRTKAPETTGTPFTGDAGSTLGKYRIIEEIGRGGQGTVYLAEDTKLARRVALKVLVRVGKPPRDALLRFQREAEVASKLSHPGICTVYGAGAENEVPYIAMQYVEGETLARTIATARESSPSTEHLAWSHVGEVEDTADEGVDSTGTSGPMTRGELNATILLVEKTARALHVAHEAGIVHRDIKPGNIMVTAEREPVLMDFGLARDTLTEGPEITHSVDRFGTPAYMSPEQLVVDPSHLDRRTDVWSLGITLFECLTLKRPFEAPTREKLYLAIQSDPLVDATRLNPAVSRDLRLVLETALERDRERRYQTALDFAEDLRRVREHEPILARPVPRWLRAWRWAQRHPAVAVGTAATVFALAGGLVLTLSMLEKEQRLAATERQRKEAAERATEHQHRLRDKHHARVLRAREVETWRREPASVEGPDGIRAWLDQAESILRRRPDYLSLLLDLLRPQLGEEQIGRAGTVIAAVEKDPYTTVMDGFASRIPEGSAAQPADDEMSLAELTSFVVQDLDALVAARRRVVALSDAIARDEKVSLVDHADDWEAAIKALRATEGFRDLAIKPQFGLVPLGPDEASGFWEFWHVASGTRPVLGEQGWNIDDETGMILVLVPSGSFHMGPEKDPMATEHDRKLGEGGERDVRAFFISKYEATQGQWIRITGDNPSAYTPPHRDFTLSHPAESISCDGAAQVLQRLGLRLPRHHEWEYAARGGTSTIWWTGNERGPLRDAINVADDALKKEQARATEPWDDGYIVHAPVSTLGPNGFGLYHVAGNVSEWCEESIPKYRAARGGGWGLTALHARSAAIIWIHHGRRDSGVGVRPARSIVQ